MHTITELHNIWSKSNKILKIDKFPITVGDVNNPCSFIKVSEDIEDLNNTVNQQTDWHLWNTPSTTAEYTLFSSSWGKLTKTDNKTNLKFKRFESKQSMFSDHNRLKLEISNRKKSGEIAKYLEMKQQTSK